MEPFSVEVLIVLEHAMDCMEKLAHHGDDRLEGFLPSLDELLVEGADVGIVVGCNHRRHEEGGSDSAVSGLADPRGLVDGGTGLVLPGIETGVCDPLAGGHVLGKDSEFSKDGDGARLCDALDGDEVVELGEEFRVLPDDQDGFSCESCDTGLEVLDVSPDVVGDRVGEFGGPARSVEAIFLTGCGGCEGRDAPRKCPKIEDFLGRRLPGHEGHTLGELEDGDGIRSVRFGSLESGLREVVDGSWVGNHDLDAWRSVESECGIEAVDARGLEADACGAIALCEEAYELPVSCGVVIEREESRGSLSTLDGYNELFGTDVDAGEVGPPDVGWTPVP